ncbi:MAG: Glycosyl hydrolase family 16 [Candidatus Methanoperedens nitroreducens]|nr:MAG: Glycosyl hydrolase family 16 [Candidatus Methanoperedens sp. BLZ1]
MISDLNVPDFSSDYHTFAIEWQPGLIRWIIDGKERFRSTLYVPDIPMYLYLNTAVGGNWPGDPDSTVVFPQYYYIDYVRVYNKI